jgi:hypothetical protein
MALMSAFFICHAVHLSPRLAGYEEGKLLCITELAALCCNNCGIYPMHTMVIWNDQRTPAGNIYYRVSEAIHTEFM